MALNADYYDQLGKQLFTDFLKQYNCPFTLTEYKYAPVDIYFGRSSVGEIKYRLKPYDSYIIEEPKIEALSQIPCSRQYYIVVLDKDIYLWSLSTIRNYQPVKKMLPTGIDSTVWKDKTIRYLPAIEADFHYQLIDNKWTLVKIN